MPCARRTPITARRRRRCCSATSRAATRAGDNKRRTVFTCLSHDIVAHETTHAVLDGLHRALPGATNPDVLAFHEAFADIVAIFQHFTLPELLRFEIARLRGDLTQASMLSDLARQFGQSLHNGRALRRALDRPDPKIKRPGRSDLGRGRRTAAEAV